MKLTPGVNFINMLLHSSYECKCSGAQLLLLYDFTHYFTKNQFTTLSVNSIRIYTQFICCVVYTVLHYDHFKSSSAKPACIMLMKLTLEDKAVV